MRRYEKVGLVVEVINIFDRLDILKRKGKNEKYDESTFLEFPFQNLDP
jgi:hypothetical protein